MHTISIKVLTIERNSMKIKITFILLFLLDGFIFSQNLQIHYDLGKDRKYVTATLEMFKPDEYGSTFTFVDFDFNSENKKSVSLAYWEIARYINIPFVNKLSATVQYNDGIARLKNSGIGISLGSAWLFGVSYPIDLKVVTLNTDLLYRTAIGSENPDFQITLTWFRSLFIQRLTFTGFLDLWTQNARGQSEKYVLLTEPQFWFSLTNHLSVGSEIEISNNFIPNTSSVQVNPTAALKWTF